MDRSIQIHRETCQDCIQHAPSHHTEPLVLTPSPSYPFQQVCADYFQIEGHSYLAVVDRFSGWLCIYAFKAHEVNHRTLQHIFRDLFIAYGVSEELSADGGPQFTAEAFQQFLKLWGVNHRLSSVSYPQSNGRAEVAVKAAKRIIHNNRSSDGGLNTDTAARAILQYRNTPLPDIELSPAQILLHRQLRDSNPAHPDHYQPHKEWVLTAEEREKALSKRNHILVKNHDATARKLRPLVLGTNVVVQRETKRWEHTGRIVEVLPYRQYRIRMFHSGRVILRNRRFLREYTTIHPEDIHPLSIEPQASAPAPSTPALESAPSTPAPPTPAPPTLAPSTPASPILIPESECSVPCSSNLPTQSQGIAPGDSQQTAVTQNLPRALKILQSFNKQGLKDHLPLGGRR